MSKRNPKFPSAILDVSEADAHDFMKMKREARMTRKAQERMTREVA